MNPSYPDLDLNLAPTIHIGVCLLTYKRPELLKVALQSVVAQNVAQSLRLFRVGNDCLLSRAVMHILVVDNDSAESGRAVFDQVCGTQSVSAHYVCEAKRGLSAARNRALSESASMDFVAFLDDDEAAHPAWLTNLLRGSATYNAAVVTGPVFPRHEHTNTWVTRGGFFDEEQRNTGETVRFVATNNVLLRSDIVTAFRFSNRFDATGGEDTEYFMRIQRAGHRMIWVNEAVVSESIPPSRANARWLLNRAHSDANRYTHSCLSFDSGPRTVIPRLITAIGGALAGVALLPLSVLGRRYAIRALRLISRAAGTLSALRGESESYYTLKHD